MGGVVLLAAAYCGAAKLGQTLRYVGSVSAIWPPVGVGIAALYLWGIRWWPGGLLGEIVVNGELWLDRTFPIGSLLGQQTGLNGRRGEVPLARNMVRTEAQRFHTWREELAVAPTLRALRLRAETIRRATLEAVVNGDRRLNNEELERLDHLSRALINKLLHEPTVRLRGTVPKSSARRDPEALTHLFALSELRA